MIEESESPSYTYEKLALVHAQCNAEHAFLLCIAVLSIHSSAIGLPSYNPYGQAIMEHGHLAGRDVTYTLRMHVFNPYSFSIIYGYNSFKVLENDTAATYT